MRKLLSTTTLALATMSIAAGPAPMEWNVDVPHSGIGFSVNHFFTPVRGEFDSYEIDLIFDRDNPANSSVQVLIDVTSVNTGNDERDAHLQSADFFDAEKYRYITFTSEGVRRVNQDEIVVYGPLTIRDQTRQVELPISILGVKDIPEEMRDMLGGVKHIASFKGGLKLDRSDYGVGAGSWAAALVVGHEVEIDIALEANR